jgi:hypothetical protein
MPRPQRKSIDKIYIQPHSRTQRIRIEQNPERPFKLLSKSVINKEKLHRSPYWWILHRRGLRRPRIGEDPLEARAIPHSLIKGTKPERIVWKWLSDHYYVPEVDFDFQCLAGHHRVLTADLQWKQISDLRVGEQLLNFSEDPISPRNGVDRASTNRRYFETGYVLSNEPGLEECAEITFSDGTRIIATMNHPWLILGRRGRGPRSQKHIDHAESVMWATTSEMFIGMRVPKYLDPWDENQTKTAGYVAGFFDADGNVCHKIKKGRENGITVTIGQQESEELDRIKSDLIQLGYTYGENVTNDPRGKAPFHHIRINGGRNESLRFLGSLRPQKLNHQFQAERLGRIDKIRSVEVIDIQLLGKQKIYRLAVSNKTYFAEGFAMHNSSLQGGRLQLGGIVCDFIFPILKIALQVQGPTHDQYARFRKDEEQRLALEAMGFHVHFIEMDIIYNEPRFEEYMRRLLGLGYPHWGGEVNGFYVVHDGTEELLEKLNEVLIQARALELSFLTANEKLLGMRMDV